MGQSRPLFVYFRHFLITISIIEKSIDGVLGIRARARRMVRANETTELWRPPLEVANLIRCTTVVIFDEFKRHTDFMFAYLWFM